MSTFRSMIAYQMSSKLTHGLKATKHYFDFMGCFPLAKKSLGWMLLKFQPKTPIDKRVHHQTNHQCMKAECLGTFLAFSLFKCVYIFSLFMEEGIKGILFLQMSTTFTLIRTRCEIPGDTTWSSDDKSTPEVMMGGFDH